MVNVGKYIPYMDPVGLDHGGFLGKSWGKSSLIPERILEICWGFNCNSLKVLNL